jgi:hypothetical protein
MPDNETEPSEAADAGPLPDEHPWKPTSPPPGGWTLAEAVSKGQRDFASAVLAATMQANLGFGPDGSNEAARLGRILWPKLVEQAVDGTIAILGIGPGMVTPAAMPIALLRVVTPDYDENSLRVGDLIYRGILMMAASPEEPALPRQEDRSPESRNELRPNPRRSRGTSEATLHAIRAIFAVIYADGPEPRRARTLTRRARQKALEIGLPGAENLDPDGSPMRGIAQVFLEAIEAVEGRAALGGNRPKPP